MCIIPSFEEEYLVLVLGEVVKNGQEEPRSLSQTTTHITYNPKTRLLLCYMK